MTEKELQELVKNKVAVEVDASLEAKTAAIIKSVADPYIKDQLKEQLDTAIKGIKDQLGVAPEIMEAERKAKEFKSGGEFLLSVRRTRTVPGYKDERLTWLPGTVEKTTGHMEIGDDAQGGFLVPEVYRAELYEIALENSIVRPYATVLPMISDSLKIPFVNDTSHVTSVYGGVIAYWTAEAATKTPSKATFGQMELTPHKLAGLTYTSNELLADSAVALEPLIRRQFGSAWGWFEDHAFLAGVGGGQPLGILNCPGLKTIHRHTLLHIYYEDLTEMYQGMLPSSLGYAYWVINPTAMTELLQMGTGNAAAASGKILNWQPDAKIGPTWTIFGRPVLITEKLSELGVQGDIGFFDFRYYLIGDRQPITIDASTHVAFTSDETCWRFVLRVAGQCWPANTLTAHSGTHTYSPFVVLEAATS